MFQLDTFKNLYITVFCLFPKCYLCYLLLQVSVLLSVLEGMTPSYAYYVVRFPTFVENCAHSIVQRWCINQKNNSCHLFCSYVTVQLFEVLPLCKSFRWRNWGSEKLNDLPKATHLVSSRARICLSNFNACALTSRFLYESTYALLSYLFHHILHFILWFSLMFFL